MVVANRFECIQLAILSFDGEVGFGYLADGVQRMIVEGGRLGCISGNSQQQLEVLAIVQGVF